MAIYNDGPTITMNESSYGATQSALVLIWSDKSKRELVKHCNEHRYVRLHNGDRPGQVYAHSLQVLRYIKGDSSIWQAVCISSSHWDI